MSALVGAAYTHVTVDGFTETGPEALVVSENSDELFSGKVGFEARASITPRFSVSTRATYEHNFFEGHRDVDATFAAGGPTFTVRALGFGEDNINLGASNRTSWNSKAHVHRLIATLRHGRSTASN